MSENTSKDKPQYEVPPLPRSSASVQPSSAVAFKLESSFLDALWARLQEERRKGNERNRGGPSLAERGGGDSAYEAYGAETLPDRAGLERLVEAAFWASLQREEGRSLKFMINYGPPASGTKLKFRAFKPYNVRVLVKLAAAVGNQILGIGVVPDTTGQLSIWGVGGFTPLTVTVLEPGQLIIKFVGENVAAITGDNPVLISSTYSAILSSFWKKFATKEEVAEFLAWSDSRVKALMIVLRTMQRFHHGGMLVVVPHGDGWRDFLAGSIPYEAEKPSTALSDLIGTVNLMHSDGILQSPELTYTESYRDTVAEALASLTSVDGAVVVTYDLRIVGFGAKFKVPPAGSSLEQPTILIYDPVEYSESVRHLTLDECDWGMRHQSAARFVLANHEAMAFVASQDGTVTAFVWEEWGDTNQCSSLVAHTRLELTMF